MRTSLTPGAGQYPPVVCTLWPQPPAHTPRLSRPSRPAHLMPSARPAPHAHIHSLQHRGAAAVRAANSAHAGSGPASGPQADAGHPVGPHQALASQTFSQLGASSGPSPCWSLVRWHCGPKVLGLLQLACTQVRRPRLSQPPASAALHSGGSAGRCQPHQAHHLGVRIR